MKLIETDNAPLPLGHYSQAIVHNDLVYVSGQLPINTENPDQPVGSIEAQTRLTLENLEAVLKAAGSSKDKVLRATIYITDLAIWGQVNATYAEFFGNHKPTRSAVPVTSLPKGFSIEIDAIATL